MAALANMLDEFIKATEVAQHHEPQSKVRNHILTKGPPCHNRAHLPKDSAKRETE